MKYAFGGIKEIPPVSKVEIDILLIDSQSIAVWRIILASASEALDSLFGDLRTFRAARSKSGTRPDPQILLDVIYTGEVNKQLQATATPQHRLWRSECFSGQCYLYTLLLNIDLQAGAKSILWLRRVEIKWSENRNFSSQTGLPLQIWRL